MNRETFIRTYREKLADAVRDHPDEYVWPLSELDAVMGRMVAALDRRSFNKDSRAFRATCKALGIKHTYAAIREYVEGLACV